MGFEICRQTAMEEQLRRRNEQLGLLAEGAKQLLSSESPDVVIQGFCERVMAHLDCQVFANFLSDPDRPRMRLAAHAGLPGEKLEAIGCPPSSVSPWNCLHRPGCQRTNCCADGTAEEENRSLQEFGIQAYACHPLVFEGRNIGTLSFGTSTRPCFTDEELELTRTVADLVAAALARKQTEQSLRENKARLRLALEGAHAGIWDWHVANDELIWSPEQYRLYGVPLDGSPLTSAVWQRVVHPDDVEAAAARLEAVLASRETRYRDEFRIVHSEHGTRWILGLGHIVRASDHPPVRLYGICIDITEHKAWEQELERRVAERTAELTATNKELEGFIYAASHDMKGPLGRINSFSTLLGTHYRDRLEGDGLMFLDLVQQNAVRLNRLVDDLLAHAQLGQQRLSLQPVEAHATVQAILHERRDDIRRQGADIRLDLPGSITVQGDPHGLSQVLRSLVDNALKYSGQAKPPVIEIGGRRQEGRCRLWIRDNGIGLDMAYKERIFEIFRRLHTYSEYPGNGIGLALVKKAMDSMGGKVWVESRVGEGATFFLELPSDNSGSPS